MFVKLFRSILEGTLHGDPETRHVFMDLLLLADQFGEVDMTNGAIAGATGVDLEVVERAIAKLREPDPDSRSEAEDGRRIVPLVPGRSWGWRIVNYATYRAIRDPHDRRAQVREATARWRERKAGECGDLCLDHPVSRGDHPVSRGDPKQRQKQKQKQKQKEDGDGARVEGDLPVSGDDLRGWKDAYPDLDVDAELKAMREWLKANPKKKPTVRGTRRFVVGWLNRSRRWAKEAKAGPGNPRRAADAAYLDDNEIGGVT